MHLKPSHWLALSATLTLSTALGCASDSGSDVDDQTIHPHKSEDFHSKLDDDANDDVDMAVAMPDAKKKDTAAASSDSMGGSSAPSGTMRDKPAGSTASGVAMPDAKDKTVSADVLMERADGDIIQTATGPNMQKVSTLVEAIKAAELVKPLKGDGPFTVFAPTNAAFDKLPAGTLDSLLLPENKQKLQSILKYHVHSGDAVLSRDIEPMKLSTLNGKDLDIQTQGDTVMVNGAKVVKTDIIANNGIIHWIDTVILP